MIGVHSMKLWAGSRTLLKPSDAGRLLPWTNSSSFHRSLCKARGMLKLQHAGEPFSFRSLQLLFYVFFLSPQHAPLSKEITLSFYSEKGFWLPPHTCWTLTSQMFAHKKSHFLPVSTLRVFFLLLNYKKQIVIKIKYILVTDESCLSSQTSYKQSVMTDYHMLSFPLSCQKTL